MNSPILTTATRTNRLRHFTVSGALSLSLFAGGCTALMLAAGAVPMAAQTRGPASRTISGKVENKSGAGIKGAVVYLKDGRTSAVKSAIADDDGAYRFVQLSQSTDYELWAQVEGRKSKSKAISSFDSKADFTFTLVIDK